MFSAGTHARGSRKRSMPHNLIPIGARKATYTLEAKNMLGMNNGFRPRFLRRYADLHTVMTDAISHYISDVKNLDFPNEKEQY
jgi:3-methyl-2-oxobutanoate hydroxymethyltransferase